MKFAAHLHKVGTLKTHAEGLDGLLPADRPRPDGQLTGGLHDPAAAPACRRTHAKLRPAQTGSRHGRHCSTSTASRCATRRRARSSPRPSASASRSIASDRFVLLGPSGCGKSTLLKAVGGYMTPSEGRSRINGRKVTEPGADRMMVFQEFDQLLPWKTVLRT